MNIQQSSGKGVNFRILFNFFIPLGISASLVTISHVIINSTLLGAPDPVVVIASYSVAMSLFGIFERVQSFYGKHAQRLSGISIL